MIAIIVVTGRNCQQTGLYIEKDSLVSVETTGIGKLCDKIQGMRDIEIICVFPVMSGASILIFYVIFGLTPYYCPFVLFSAMYISNAKAF